MNPPQLQRLAEELGKPVVGFRCTGMHAHQARRALIVCHRHRHRPCQRLQLHNIRCERPSTTNRCTTLPPLERRLTNQDVVSADLCPHAGWSYSKAGVQKREQDGTLSYGIPYSEHSSWLNLRDCVRTFRPKRLVRLPTPA